MADMNELIPGFHFIIENDLTKKEVEFLLQIMNGPASAKEMADKTGKSLCLSYSRLKTLIRKGIVQTKINEGILQYELKK